MKTIAVAVIALMSLGLGQSAGAITAVQASPFLGEWTIGTTSPATGGEPYQVAITLSGDSAKATVKGVRS